MKMSTKIGVLLVGVLVLAVLSSAAALVSIRHSGELMRGMVAENLASVRAAEELAIAFLEQRGFVSSYILDEGNRYWLDELSRREPSFAHWLARARETAFSREERDIITEIADVYQNYDAKREAAIALYDSGRVDEARQLLLEDIAAAYDRVYALCEKLIQTNERFIEARMQDGRQQTRRHALYTGVCVSLTLALSTGLFLVFFRGILRPLRQMATQARTFAGPPAGEFDSPRDELRAVGFYLSRLMSDVSETRSDLERSRGRLVHAEKLASVGKLAASVAHEIRNPLTSVKMRLFSLRRELAGDPHCEDDLRVVSEEIARLESVIRNFLEFARPPDLHLQIHAAPALLDKTLELGGHRLAEKDIELVRSDSPDLPFVEVDAEQLRQVFLNLLINAAEAMGEGGRLEITLTLEQDRHGAVLAVRFRDSGPGVPEDVRARIFEPFFTTKDSGTGLGLCIAASIMARHGGRLELEESSPQGAVFAVFIPVVHSRNHG